MTPGPPMSEGTYLLRQVHPTWLDNDGKPSSQTFRPTPKDAGLLSVYNGDLIGPEAAFAHFTVGRGHLSAGVLAVTAGECAQVPLPARPDPAEFPEHAVIDFTALSAGQTDRAARKLKSFALARGWQHRPTEGKVDPS